MYSCTPLSIEPDLCEVAWLAWPTEQLAVALYMAMVVTGNSDEGVLTSDTWEEGTTRVSLAPWSPCHPVTMLLCQLTWQIPLLFFPWSILRKPFLSEGFIVSLTCCRMFLAPLRCLYVCILPGEKQEDHQSVRLTRSMTCRTSCCLTLYCWFYTLS